MAMTARDKESSMLTRCAVACRGSVSCARSQQEANVFRVAAMVVQSRFPDESARLMKASEHYFKGHPGERLPSAAVVEKGWVFSLPRLRDMLTRQLCHR